MDERTARNGSVVIPATAASSLACLRSLGRRGIHTIVVSERETAPALYSRYCDETRVVPSPTEDLLGYRDALLSLARRRDVRAIVPIRESDVWTLTRFRSAFAEHVAPLWPPEEGVRTVYDRLRLVEAASTAGVSVPETQRLGDVDDWDRELIVKPRYAVLANEFVESVPRTELVDPGSVRYVEPGVEPDREAIRAEMGHEPIVQEFVRGGEYAHWALYDRGEPVATCGKEQLRGYTYAGNTSVARATTSNPALEATGRRLLDALGWHGPASVQFVENAETGEFTLLEVNPRFWVSLQCPVQAGLDFPYYYWCLANGAPVPERQACEDGVTTHLLRGELLHLRSVLRDEYPLVDPPPFPAALYEVASSIYDQPHFDTLSATDPLPFARDALNAATATARRLRR